MGEFTFYLFRGRGRSNKFLAGCLLIVKAPRQTYSGSGKLSGHWQRRKGKVIFAFTIHSEWYSLQYYAFLASRNVTQTGTMSLHTRDQSKWSLFCPSCID